MTLCHGLLSDDAMEKKKKSQVLKKRNLWRELSLRMKKILTRYCSSANSVTMSVKHVNSLQYQDAVALWNLDDQELEGYVLNNMDKMVLKRDENNRA